MRSREGPEPEGGPGRAGTGALAGRAGLQRIAARSVLNGRALHGEDQAGWHGQSTGLPAVILEPPKDKAQLGRTSTSGVRSLALPAGLGRRARCSSS